ncbi:hypothetical protein [Nocardia sp. BMG111209]|uniref:hypothetical protein n=1 Tax=Nocardia sp. BMG111209 TaxID=1160137 RepID=UPI000372E0BC|nr:hypothetical protein [Nocardia sp. BMG111209]
MTIVVRVALFAIGLGTGWYGVNTLLGFPTADLISVAEWFSGAILLHDAVFAPLAAAVGLGARRILPTGWWAPAACGAVCTVALLAVSVPVLTRHGARPLNPTVLDRPYPAGLAAAILVVWALVVLSVVVRRLRGHGERYRYRGCSDPGRG